MFDWENVQYVPTVIFEWCRFLATPTLIASRLRRRTVQKDLNLMHFFFAIKTTKGHQALADDSIGPSIYSLWICQDISVELLADSCSICSIYSVLDKTNSFQWLILYHKTSSNSYKISNSFNLRIWKSVRRSIQQLSQFFGHFQNAWSLRSLVCLPGYLNYKFNFSQVYVAL